LSLHELLDRRADVAKPRSWHDGGYAEVEGAPGDLGDLDRLLGRRSHVKSCGSVAVEALVDVSHVDVDDVAVAQDLAARDAVADDLVDGGTDALGEAAI